MHSSKEIASVSIIGSPKSNASSGAGGACLLFRSRTPARVLLQAIAAQRSERDGLVNRKGESALVMFNPHSFVMYEMA